MRAALERLTADLSQLCRAQIIGPCASVSLVGRNIRGILHQLGDALELFAEQRIYMVSQAANDLNFTFVVDEDQGERLVQELHDLLIRPVRGDTRARSHLGAAVRRQGRARPRARQRGGGSGARSCCGSPRSTTAPTSTIAPACAPRHARCAAWRPSTACSTR